MNRCILARSSRTAKWFTTINRTYTTAKPISSEQENDSNSDPSAPEPAVSAEVISEANTISHGVGSLGGTQDGRSSTSNLMPRKRRDLPISPLMDPEVIVAREKHKLPKLPPSKNPTLFQQQLANNPYAQALATPIRQCQLTNTRLPSYFLQDFELMAHPETREPWWVPTSLRKKHHDREATAAEEEPTSVISDQDSERTSQAQKFDGDIDAAKISETLPADMNAPSASLKITQSTRPSLGPGVYTLSRQALLLSMHNRKSGWHMPPWEFFSHGFFKASTAVRKLRDYAIWRKDMDSFVLELIRRRVVEGLVYLVQRKRGYVAGCVDWEDARMAGRQQGAILWTGKKGEAVTKELLNSKAGVEAQPELAADEDRSSSHYPGRDDPPGFATLTIGKDKPHMVPVHNLPLLLGPEHLAALRKKCRIFDKEVLILRDRNVTVDIRKRLWKLQGYIAFPEVRDGTYEKA